jgi:hypothetical protein
MLTVLTGRAEGASAASPICSGRRDDRHARQGAHAVDTTDRMTEGIVKVERDIRPLRDADEISFS